MLENFNRDGYAVVRGFFAKDEFNYYKSELDALSASRKEKWTLPDGMAQQSAFWNVTFNEKMLENVRLLLGPNIKFLQHNDLHVGFSSFTWHRDSVCRSFGNGPDWDESETPYQIVRVGIYLQDGAGGFRLGMVPDSHRPDRYLPVEVHFRNHYNYYRHLRTDLGYRSLHPDLVKRLKTAKLYANEATSTTPIPGAWLPSKAFQLVSKRFK